MPFFADTFHPPHPPGTPAMPGCGTPLPSATDGAALAGLVGVRPFQFQPRRASVDWRRFSAIDVERVARELDVATLQEHIAGVTFCNLDSERCPSCGQPVDPVLLKVLKMAQLSIEYLLHCQESLSAALTLQAGRLQAALDELTRAKQEAARQAEELRGVKEESRRRKKLIATQQLLLQAGANSYHKCQLCDKAFVNYSFLQAHVQRRHAEASEAERQQKKQVEQMEDEIQELKVKLRETQQRLEAERDAEKLRREHETEKARQREEEGRRDFERWKEEERTKLHQELDGLRQLFLTEFKDIASRSSAVEGKLQELQARNVTVSNLGTLQDDDYKEKHHWAVTQAELRDVREKMDVQRDEWKQKLKELRREHLAQEAQLKNENEKLRATLFQDHQAVTDHFRQEMDTLSARLRDQTEVIKSQEKMIKLLSASKPEVTREAPKVATAKESSEEDTEDILHGKQRLLEALRRNPNLLKQFRPILEEMLEEKLESMGVRKVAKGISTQTYKNLQTLVRIQQQQKAERFPELLHLRDKLIRAVMWKVRQSEKPNVKSQKSPWPLRWSPPSSQPVVKLAALQPGASAAPRPAPRSRARTPHSSPGTLPRTTQTLKASNPANPHLGPVPQPSPRARSEVTLGWEQAGLSPTKLRPPTSTQKEQMPSKMMPDDDTESDESALDSPEETAGPGTTVSAVVKVLERRLDTTARKPAGGVKLFPERSSGSPKASQPTKKLQVVEDITDLDTSSLEDLVAPREPPEGRRRPAARLGCDSAGSPVTSAWSSGSAGTRGW
ncbi:cilium assembly protein DZIP1L isoform X2 [Rhea pennata]|uniref:cilium assembly protein DZIP1L isoform X2 n=1 Tax=Rhea pennata TaxID=8795 RepID=UPI002E263099